MKKNLLLLLLVCITCLSNTFCQNSLVYKISGNNLSNPSYLFGTIHMICEHDFELKNNLIESYNNTSQVCFEIDINDMSAQLLLAQSLLDNTGKNAIIHHFNSEETDQLIEKLDKETGMGAQMVQLFKPLALISYLSKDFFNCDQKLLSYEVEIGNKAKADNKKVLGIESIQTQIDALASMEESKIIAMTKLILHAKNSDSIAKEASKYYEETASMIDAYKKEDIEKLYTLITNSNDLSTINQSILLDKRNQSWIPIMEKMMQKNATLFAFGAGHLAGEMGVINLLKQKGYTVEAIYN